jgi:Xaa-Pro aminopeptidase
VQTQHSVLKRGGLYWDRDTAPPAMYQDHVERIQAAIDQAGDDAWILYGDAQRYGAVAYASHFLPRARSALVLVPRSGQPVLLASVGPRDVPAAKTLTAVEDVRPFVRLPREAIRLLMEQGLGQKQVGLVGARGQLSAADWEAISSELPEIRWEHRDAVLDQLRASKSAAEQAVIGKAGEVVEAGLSAAAGAFTPGTTVRQALAAVDKAMRYAGAEDVRLLIGLGSGSLRPASDAAIAAGQPICLLAAAEVQRYWSEAARTYIAAGAQPSAAAGGTPGAAGAPGAFAGAMAARGAGAAAALAQQAVDAMAAAAVAGATAGAVADAARAVLSSATGWTSTSADAYGLGHGIGLDLEEPPAIAAGSTERLQAGAALALHVVLPGQIAGRTLFVT